MHKGCRFTEAPVGTGYLCKLLRTTRLVRVNKKKQKRWKKKKKTLAAGLDAICNGRR